MPYHPTVTTLAIDDPSGDLACGLDDQQAAEALCNLEGRGAISQRLVPGAYRGILQQALAAKDPVVHTLKVGSLGVKGALYPARVVGRVDGEFVEAPYEQCGYCQPLRPSHEFTQEPSEARRVGRC